MRVGIRGMVGAASAAIVAVTVVAMSLLAGPSALAHHSFAVHFVGDELVTVNGVVTDFTFRNPHGLVLLDETRADGTIVHWPNGIKERGGRRATPSGPAMWLRSKATLRATGRARCAWRG